MADRLAVIQEEESIQALRAIKAEMREVIAASRDLRTETDALNRSLQSGRIRDVNSSMQALSQTSQQYETVTNQLSAAERRLQQVERQLSIAQSEHGQQIANVTAQTRQLTAAQRQRANEEARLAELSDRERQRLGNTLNIYNAVQQKMSKLQSEYRNLATAKQLGMTLTDREEKRMANLEKRIQNYDKTLKAVDASMGIYRRNVGNYASGFNALNNSVAQIAREAPAFTYSVQTGMMAIANNVPIFFDAMRAAREQNAALRAEGKATVPVWKQLGAAIFSWNTILMVGITLLTVYGKEFGEWIKTLKDGDAATAMLKKNTEDLNKARKDGAKSAAGEISTLETLYRVATNENAAKEARIRAINKLQSLYPSFFKNLSDEAIMVGNAKDKYLQLRAAILDSAKARAIGNILEQRQEEQLVKEEELRRKLDVAVKDGIELDKKKNQTTTQYVNDGQGGRILKEISNDELSKRNDRLIYGYLQAIKKSQNDFVKANKMLIDQKTGLENQKNVLLYEGDKYGKADKQTKPKVDSLSVEQRNTLMRMEASKDQEMAINEKRYTQGLINEKEYLKEIQDITVAFNTKKINYLKGSNAKEVLEVSKAELEIEKAKRTFNEKAFEIESKELEEKNKRKLNQNSIYLSELEKDQSLTNSERLDAQIKHLNDLYNTTDKYYNDLITLAENRSQSTLEIERKRDEEIAKIQNERDSKIKTRLDVYKNDLDQQYQITSASSTATVEEQRRLILSDKKLSNSEKEYRITLLNIDRQIKENQLELEKLTKLKTQYDLKVAMANISGKKNPEAESESARLNAEIERLKAEIARLNGEAKDTIDDKTKATREALAKGFSDLGFSGLADAYSKTMDRLKGKTMEWRDYAVLAASAVLDSLTQLNNKQKEQTISSLNEQLKNSRETTDQELEFINKRLERLNNLDELTKEQLSERNRLEDEARTLKEQQQQREKLIEIQKARAEQKAAAQQALINGALAATNSLAQYGFTPAGAIAAALALAFGIAQSVSISSRNPVPQYWKGRKDGPAEFALTQERGREIIADRTGNIKSLGSDGGAKMTWLDRGDIVYTASETSKILSKMKGIPKIGQNIFRKAALQSFNVPVIIQPKQEDYSQKIIDGFAVKMESIFKRNTNPDIQHINGKLIQFHGSNNPVIRGEYDLKTGEETWY